MSDQIITLVKYKTFYMPRDSQDFLLMRKLRMPVSRLHESALGILRHQAHKNDMHLKGVAWKSILTEAREGLTNFWSGDHFNTEYSKGRMLLSTAHASVIDLARNRASTAEGAIRRFLTRWGFVGEFNYSESRDKVQLVCDYEFSAERMPAVSMGPTPEEAEPCTFTVGFTQFRFTRTDRFLIWSIWTMTGSEWKEMRSGRSLLNEVSDPSDLIRGLLALPPTP